MSTSLQALREKLSRRTGEYREGVTTAAGTASNATVIDSGLADKGNDYYNRWYIRITSGTASSAEKQIADFASATGTITASAAFSAQIAASCTYELHRVAPVDKDNLIKEALRQLYPDIHKKVADESLISGTWLRDGDMEDWASSTAVRYFTEASNITWAKESTIKRFGLYSAKATSGAASAYWGQTESDNPWLLDLGGMTVHFRAWCKTDTASHARLHIYTVDNAGTAQNLYSSYHTGSNRWELLELEDQILNASLRSISIRFHGDVNTKIAYWDYARVLGPHQYRYHLPPTLTRLAQAWLQTNANVEGEEDPCDDLSEMEPMTELLDWKIEDDGTDKVIAFKYPHTTGRKLRLIGTTYLTQPTSDSATTEIDEPQTDLVVAHAAYMIYSRGLGVLPAGDLTRVERLADFWEKEYLKLRRQHVMILPPRTM